MTTVAAVKECACGAVHTRQGWGKLDYVGLQVDGEEAAELRLCACGSTLVLPIEETRAELAERAQQAETACEYALSANRTLRERLAAAEHQRDALAHRVGELRRQLDALHRGAS